MQKVNNEGTAEHVLEFSQGFSATHFKGKSSLKKHLGFFQSSHAEKAASKEPGKKSGKNKRSLVKNNRQRSSEEQSVSTFGIYERGHSFEVVNRVPLIWRNVKPSTSNSPQNHHTHPPKEDWVKLYIDDANKGSSELIRADG
ncbi:hypothetical protein SADUNF_Sadunf02G0098200 [Salix dunnii]|uniref:Uncharacterized protein n=1 Tax=Salix dunnii TaxID=1413687 RepID=A0A835TJH0_9ROSI|nr:hypothetical protein SADUNF_Sadunf02G0098200 [Salix dunnii]